MTSRSAYTSRADLGLLLVRSSLAAAFFFHGTQKLFGWFGGDGGLAGFAAYLAQLGAPLPSVSAALAATSEVAGALVLLTGRGFVALAPLAFTMLVAAATSVRNGYDVTRGGAEYPLTLLALLVALLLTGPGGLVLWASARRRAVQP